MVNFGPLAAEIGSVVWGNPSNFNGFRVLAALLHGNDVVVAMAMLDSACAAVQRREAPSVDTTFHISQ